MLYVPGTREGRAWKPVASVVVVVRSSFVAVFRTTTVAPGTAAPAGSVTGPWMLAEFST